MSILEPLEGPSGSAMGTASSHSGAAAVQKHGAQLAAMLGSGGGLGYSQMPSGSAMAPSHAAGGGGGGGGGASSAMPSSAADASAAAAGLSGLSGFNIWSSGGAGAAGGGGHNPQHAAATAAWGNSSGAAAAGTPGRWHSLDTTPSPLLPSSLLPVNLDDLPPARSSEYQQQQQQSAAEGSTLRAAAPAYYGRSGNPGGGGGLMAQSGTGATGWGAGASGLGFGGQLGYGHASGMGGHELLSTMGSGDSNGQFAAAGAPPGLFSGDGVNWGSGGNSRAATPPPAWAGYGGGQPQQPLPALWKQKQQQQPHRGQ